MKKNIYYTYLYCLAFLLLTAACGKDLPTLTDVDLKLWQKDKNACGGKRMDMEKAIVGQKEKFLGLTEMQIVTLLGRPDHNELYKRNQKFYYYFIQPSTDCASTTLTTPRELTIRFTAMGVANEVSVE